VKTDATGAVTGYGNLYGNLLDYVISAELIFYILTIIGIFVLRRKSGYQPPFRVPGYPVTPAIFVVATILLLGNAIIDPTSRVATLSVLGTTLLGIPVYFLASRSREIRKPLPPA